MNQMLDNILEYLKSNELNKALEYLINQQNINKSSYNQILIAKLMMLLGQEDRFNSYIKSINIEKILDDNPETYIYNYMYYSLIDKSKYNISNLIAKFNSSCENLKQNQLKIEKLLKIYTDKKVRWKSLELHFESIGSTNAYIKEQESLDKKVRIVSADQQLDGRGQRSHSFSSPRGGLYISLNINVDNYDLELVTPKAGVIVAKSLKKITDKDIKIKWLNDLYLKDKKIAGILCESAIDTNRQVHYTIVGIGLDLIEDEPIPKELENVMTTLFGSNYSLSTSDIVENVKYYLVPDILSMQEGIDYNKLLEDYNEMLYRKNEQVLVYNDNEKIYGKLVGINNKFELVVDVDGVEKSYSYGNYRQKDIS